VAVAEHHEREREWQSLVDEQAALRRVATLVARGVSPAAVFTAVTLECTRVLGADASGLFRYEDGQTMVLLAHHIGQRAILEVGGRLPLDTDSAAARVWRTRAPARIESYADLEGPVAELHRALGFRASVAAPIIVEGELWGVVATSFAGAPAPDSEARLGEFTELIATAIANAESRAELAASRARIVLAGDEVRQRIERNLHDSTQQRLVALALSVRTARARVGIDPALAAELDRIASIADEAVEELRDIARGLHPAVLERGGLGPALRALERRSAVPVELSVEVPGRLPEPLEIAAYYIVSEAITNTAKYARATVIEVVARADESELTLAVRDDGVGGADPAGGSGLIGLRDRVEALGGTLEIASPRGQGTTLTMRMPIRPEPARELASAGRSYRARPSADARRAV
jgi:signal transduction histidine kinase